MVTSDIFGFVKYKDMTSVFKKKLMYYVKFLK